MDETTLILETQNGDLDSFNNIVLTYQSSIFNTAFYMLGDDELAADATQDAFISALRNINTYRGGSFKAWLMRIVTNGCYDELRRLKRRPTTQIHPKNTEDEDIETSRWLVSAEMSPEEKFDAGQLKQRIHYCLDALPIDFRTVVILIDIQGMNYNEAASAIQVPLGTIKSRLARARLRLREHLQEFYEVLPISFQRPQESL